MNDILKKNSIYNNLRYAIESGKYKPEERLPGETSMAQDFGVSRVTLRDALKTLAEDGLITRVHGKGTFVSKNGDRINDKYIILSQGQIDDDGSPGKYIASGIESVLEEHGYSYESFSREFIIAMTPQEASCIFKENSVKGIFLLENSFNGDEPELALLSNCGLPVVVPHANFYEERIANFAVLHSDTRLAFGDGIRFLARQGHKRVGTIFRSIRQYHCRGFSTEEYLEFLSYNGLDDAKSLVKYVEYSRDQIIHATRELMLGPTPPTAIACFSDFFAIHVYDALKALRIKIPEEVAVMGFCGYNGGQFLSPSLSTVDLMYDNIAKMSVDVMLKSKEWFNKNQPVSIVTPHRLVPKASTQANMLQQQQK